MKLISPFIRLPYRFDAQRLEQEIRQIPRSDWQCHPSKHKGNFSIPLITVNGEINDQFAGPMKATGFLGEMPYTAQVIASFGEVVSRSRIMILEGGCTIPMHCDINYHWYRRVRIHIPVVTNPNVVFISCGKSASMPAGEAWLLDTWGAHHVQNRSAETRIHLVVDTCGSAKFWELVKRSEKPAEEDGEPGPEPRYIAYQEGRQVNIVTEQYNVPVVMSPGEVEGLAADILDDMSQHPDNDPELAATFTEIVSYFIWDWRALYSMHGPAPDGWQYYRELIEKTVQSVQPMSHQLLLGSNNASAPNTLCARVLWPAFNENMAGYYK